MRGTSIGSNVGMEEIGREFKVSLILNEGVQLAK